MKSLSRFLFLPPELTSFERAYLERVNRIALYFFVLHVPVMMFVAYVNDTSALQAMTLTFAVVAGPALARRSLASPRAISVVHGVAAMFMGGLLVHFGQGPMQIEMHFYFFALLAMCAVFGNPMVVIAATATVAVHHLVVWLVLPRSVFNYDATAWVVLVHAAFVVLEAIASCFIARSFFDNVIGLERIVEARTAALDLRNREMRMLLDSVEQGFLTIDKDAVIAPERSAVVDRWFGEPADGETWPAALARISPQFSELTACAWVEVQDGIMPLELTIEQMPHTLTVGEKVFDVRYRPVGANPHDRYLVIVSDVTSRIEQERADRQRQEAMALFEHILADRTGTETFLEEGTEAMRVIEDVRSDAATVRRMVHTLKGNASLMGLRSISTSCHELEDFLMLEEMAPTAPQLAPLRERWKRLLEDAGRLLGKQGSGTLVSERDFEALVQAVARGEAKDLLEARVAALKLEPVDVRLRHFAEQARQIAERLEKPDVEVHVVADGVRLDAKEWAGFWSAFVHAIRNAADHGIENRTARALRGKSTGGCIELRASDADGAIVIEVADDGNGIDWEGIRARARRLGMPAETPEDLHRCLLADGVSTAARVTEVSGRGVGMSALLSATEERGGQMEVKSVPGKGTIVKMIFPKRRAPRRVSPEAA